MGLFRSMNVSGSALTAQRLRMDIIANNVANMNTTRTAQGGPYRRQSVTFREKQEGVRFGDFLGRAQGGSSGDGVEVHRIVHDNAPARRVFEPTHPDADGEGFVLMPNVDVVTEMTDLVSARRAYEASVTVLNATKSMAQRALDIGRG